MYSSLKNDYLYSAYKISTEFVDSNGKVICGDGTAFFVLDDLRHVHLVTNRHNVDLNFKEPTGKYTDFKLTKVVLKGKGKDSAGLPTIDQEFQISIGRIAFSTDENDIAIFIQAQARKNPDGSNKSIDFPIPIRMLADRRQIHDDLQIGDVVGFPGYPEWYDRAGNRPIFRIGTISSDTRFNYSHGKLVNGDCIAYEAFSFGGSSGSPVFALQRGLTGSITTYNARELLLIGVNAGHLKTSDQFNHSGISYFYRSDIVLEMIGIWSA